jgi:hypothetical protein
MTRQKLEYRLLRVLGIDVYTDGVNDSKPGGNCGATIGNEANWAHDHVDSIGLLKTNATLSDVKYPIAILDQCSPT